MDLLTGALASVTPPLHSIRTILRWSVWGWWWVDLNTLTLHTRSWVSHVLLRGRRERAAPQAWLWRRHGTNLHTRSWVSHVLLRGRRDLALSLRGL